MRRRVVRILAGGVFAVLGLTACAVVGPALSSLPAPRTGGFVQYIFFPQHAGLGGNWHYLMQVDVLWPRGVNGAAECDKDVRVRIFDKNERVLLDDMNHFSQVRGLESTGTWSEPGRVSIEIRETAGDPNWSNFKDNPSNDAYNRQLWDSGGKVLRRLTYRLDSASGRFEEGP